MISALALHKSWVVFLGTFVFGESVVLASSALAAHGSWSWQAVAGWAFLGTVVSDTVWFRSAAAGIERWTVGERGARLAVAARRLDRVTGERPHRALLGVKFMYGTRVASIAYMAIRKVRLATFVTFDAVGTALWLGVMIPIGWAIGKGVDQAGVRLREVEWLVLGIIVAAAATKGARQWWNTRAG